MKVSLASGDIYAVVNKIYDILVPRDNIFDLCLISVIVITTTVRVYIEVTAFFFIQTRYHSGSGASLGMHIQFQKC